MSHEVESMAFAHEVPWHGLGVNVDPRIGTIEMLSAANLDWQVEKVPLYMSDSQEPVPDTYAIRRATDKTVYDTVSGRWKPVQNSEILDFFREWTAAGDATMETAGSLRGGKQVWALANLKTGFILPGGDAVKGYVLMVGSHEAGRSTLIRTTAIRVVCANTLALAMSQKAQSEVRWSHARDFKPEVAKQQLGLSRDSINDMGHAAQKLLNLKLSDDDVVRVLSPIFNPKVEVETAIADEKERSPTLTAILWAHKKGKGAIPNTGWGVISAVTFFSDHMAKTATPDGRFFAAQLGHHAKHKQQTWDALMQMAS